MKVEVQIDSHFEEAVVIWHLHGLRVWKSVTLMEGGFKKGHTCRVGETYLIESQLFNVFTLNRQVVERIYDRSIIQRGRYQLSKACLCQPQNFPISEIK